MPYSGDSEIEVDQSAAAASATPGSSISIIIVVSPQSMTVGAAILQIGDAVQIWFGGAHAISDCSQAATALGVEADSAVPGDSKTQELAVFRQFEGWRDVC